MTSSSGEKRNITTPDTLMDLVRCGQGGEDRRIGAGRHGHDDQEDRDMMIRKTGAGCTGRQGHDDQEDSDMMIRKTGT